jgi:predicted ATPase
MATTYDIEVTQGSELDLRLNVKNDAGVALTLEGYKLRGVVKHRYGDATAYIDLKPKVFTDSSVTPAITAASGLVDIFLSGVQTSGLAIGVHRYDLERYNEQEINGVTTEPSVFKLMKGKFVVTPEVTNI